MPPKTSPTCTPGRRSTCRAPAGSASTPPPGCWPAKVICLWPAPPTRRAPRRSPAASMPRCRVLILDVGRAHPRDAARHQALHRRPVAGDPGAGRAGGRTLAGWRRAADGGRRADVRLHRRHGRRRVEHRRRWAGEARAGDRPGAAAARPVRAGRPAALRPGQVVSGREPAALGLRHLLAARRQAAVDGSDAGRHPARPVVGRHRRRRSPRRGVSPARWASIPSARCRRTRIRSPTSRANAACRRTSIRSTRSWRTPRSGRGWRASSSTASANRPAGCCRSSAGTPATAGRAG